MQIINTKHFKERIIDCFVDDLYLYVITQDSHINISKINPATLNFESDILIESVISDKSRPCTDESCIHLPTKFGQILSIDKFSGNLLMTANLGYTSVASNFLQDEKYLYCICTTPISHKYATKVINQSVCRINKETGAKERQSQSFESEHSLYLSMSGNSIFAAIGNQLIRFDFNLQVQSQLKLSAHIDFQPINTDDFVIVGYKTGLIERIKIPDMLLDFRHRFRTSNLGPVNIGNSILWCTSSGVFDVDQVYPISPNIQTVIQPISSNLGVLFYEKPGELVLRNIEGNHASKLEQLQYEMSNPKYLLAGPQFFYLVGDNDIASFSIGNQNAI